VPNKAAGLADGIVYDKLKVPSEREVDRVKINYSFEFASNLKDPGRTAFNRALSWANRQQYREDAILA